MLKLFRKSEKLILAVDIGHKNTKVIAMSKLLDRKAKIQKAISRPTPLDSFKGGAVADEEKLVSFLSRLVADMNISENMQVVAGLSGLKGLITKKIDIPNIEPAQIPEHLPFEVEQYLPYDINDLDLDYEILKKNHGGSSSSKTLSLFVVAVLISSVKEYDRLFSKAFLNYEIMDANVLALSNIFEWNYGIDEKSGFLLMDIGHNHTNMAVVDSGEVIFTRSVPAGGSAYTEKIKNNLQVDYQEAEDLKINSQGRPEAVEKALAEVHSLFCDELYSGYESFKTFFPEVNLSSVFMTGGGSQTEGLTPAVEKKFSLPVKAMDSLKNVEGISNAGLGKDTLNLYFATALGLALRGVME